MFTLRYRMPVRNGDIVILGGEQLCYADWAELFADARVRNKSTKELHVKDAIEFVQEQQGNTPSKIIMQVGIDDLIAGESANEFASDFRRLLSEIKSNLPQTEPIVLSLAPINPTTSILPHANLSNEIIKNYNDTLRAIATAEGIVWVNIYDSLTDVRSGLLSKDFAMTDGYHLNSNAYFVIKDRLSPFVIE